MITTRDIANLIRERLNSYQMPIALGYADSVTVPGDPADARPAAAEFVITDDAGTEYCITVADLSQTCKHPEDAESEATFSFCTLCGEVTSS